MLVYEKKVDAARHLFGTHGNVPADADKQLKYKAKDGTVLTPVAGDSYVDAFDEDGKRGIRRLSDNKFFGVFIGDDQKAIIPEGWEATPAPTPVLESISVSKEPNKTEYDYQEGISMEGLMITCVYSVGPETKVAWGDPGLTCDPEEGTYITENKNVTIKYGGKEATQLLKFVPKAQSISVKTAPAKVSYASGEELSMQGLIVDALYKNGSHVDINYGDPGLSYKPVEGTPVTASGNVEITLDGKTCEQPITVA